MWGTCMPVQRPQSQGPTSVLVLLEGGEQRSKQLGGSNFAGLSQQPSHNLSILDSAAQETALENGGAVFSYPGAEGQGL